MAKLLKTTCIEAVPLRLCLQCALARKITQTCILQTLFNKHFIEQNITFYTSTWRIKLSEYNGINIKFIHVVRLSDIDLWKHRILTIICIFYWFQLRAFSHYNVYACVGGRDAGVTNNTGPLFAIYLGPLITLITFIVTGGPQWFSMFHCLQFL